MGEIPFTEVIILGDPQKLQDGCFDFVRGSYKANPKLVNGGRISDD